MLFKTIKNFLKHYDDFFSWAGINEEQFLKGDHPNINGYPVVSSEWTDEYPDLKKLIVAVEDVLVKKNYTFRFFSSMFFD